MRYEERPIDDEAKRKHNVLVTVSMRWLPYKKNSEQHRNGIEGRWQIANEYGWENLPGDGPATYLVPITE